MGTGTHLDRRVEFSLGGRTLPLIGPARVYLCGITPYDVTHLGHAATFVWADAMTSIMRLAGTEVVVCRNVTDIDDALTDAAARRARHPDELAVTREFLFDQDMAALRVNRPAHTPRAHRYVGQVIKLAAALLDTGLAYASGGQVYFRGRAAAHLHEVASPAEHGELDNPDEDTEASRREDPYDVAIWRCVEQDELGWPSPWGPGKPGWHAECAAIAAGVLGSSVDVVAGGADLSYPHHTYQAAMVEGATGVLPFARANFAVGTVRYDGHKMAKSTGNLVLVSELLDAHSAAAIRLLVLDRDWRAAWDFDFEDLAAAADRLDRLYSAAGRSGGSSAVSERAAAAVLLTDLDVPRALDVAEDSGGATARLVLRTLSLS
jgi:L-cysteine:1D-myo-inositol 2-amino-2-deoxy-alpha-D-glucopyranoside ligase